MPEVMFRFGKQMIKYDRLRKTRNGNSMFALLEWNPHGNFTSFLWICTWHCLCLV